MRICWTKGAALLAQLVLTHTAKVILTVRRGEETHDAVSALWRDELIARLDLRALDPPEVHRLLTEALGGQIDRRSAERLCLASNGNALLLRELVIDVVEAGSLREVGGVWVWNGEVAARQRLVEVVGARLGHLDPISRRAMEYLAVGEPISPSVLSTVLGEVDADAGTALTALEQRGLVRVETDGRRREVRLGHPLYGDVVQATLTATETHQLQRDLAEVLTSSGLGRRGDRLRLAVWHLHAAIPIETDALVAASRQASAVCDGPLAEELARAAVRQDPTFGSSLALGEALSVQGRWADAEQALAPLIEAAASDAEHIDLGTLRWKVLLFGLGDGDSAEAALTSAEHALFDERQRDWLRALRVCCLSTQGKFTEALELGLPLLRDDSVDERARLRALVGVGTSLSLVGRTGEAKAAADELLEPALRHTNDLPYAVGWVFVQRVVAMFSACELREARQVLENLNHLAVIDHDDSARGSITLALGRIALAEGRLRDADAFLREAAALLRLFDPDCYLPWTLVALAQVAAQQGRADDAGRALDEGLAAANPSVTMYWVDATVARAWVAAAGGRLAEARNLAIEAAEVAHDQEARVLEAFALHEALRLGVPARSLADRLDMVAEGVESADVPVFAAHALAVARQDASALGELSRRFQELGMLLFAAEAASEAATAHRNQGDQAAAAACMERVTALMATCGEPCTPVLEHARFPSPLTEREHEMINLVAAGHSNRDIADLLVVSVRTVEGHLSRAYAKLGIANRSELRDVFSRPTSS